MFLWNSKVYMDEKVKKKPAKYRKIVEKNKKLKSCFCVTMPINSCNSMEIYSSREFMFRYYADRQIEIVGLAATERGANELVCKIVEDVYEKYGDISAEMIHNFFR